MKKYSWVFLFCFFLSLQNIIAQKFGGGNGTGYGSVTVINLILPVELISFSAEAKTESIILKWETSFEADNAYFNIQRSINGIDWSTIGKVEGSGNINISRKYQFTDKDPLIGHQLYRLKQVNIDGTYAFSSIESVHFKKEFLVKVFPNPAIDKLFLKWSSTATFITISISNSAGQVIFKQTYNNLQATEININSLPVGIYLLTLKKNEGIQYLNFVKEVP